MLRAHPVDPGQQRILAETVCFYECGEPDTDGRKQAVSLLLSFLRRICTENCRKRSLSDRLLHGAERLMYQEKQQHYRDSTRRVQECPGYAQTLYKRYRQQEKSGIK